MDVKEAFTSDIVSIKENSPIKEAIKLLRRLRLDALPVVNESENLVGMFTKYNAYDVLLQGINYENPVKSVMVQEPATIQIDKDFEDSGVSQSFFGQCIVLDKDNFPVGMITKATVALALYRKSDMLAGFLSAILEEMEHGVVAIQKEGIINVFNRKAAELTGLDPREVIGHKAAEVLPLLDIERVLDSEESIKMQRHKVEERSFLANIRTIQGQEGKLGAMALLHDLTQIELMTGELESVRQLNNTLDTILESAYDGVVVINEDGYVTMVNKRMSDFLRKSANEILNRHVTEVLQNTRLHLVAKNGIAEYSDVQKIRGASYIVSRIPIIQNGKSVGAVGKVNFQHLDELKSVVKKMEVLEKQLDKYREEVRLVHGARYTFGHIITVNHEVEMAKKEAKRAALGNLPVLLLGPSGTGKELFAHAIHNAGPRRGAPFVKVNCAAIPEELLESEFFGYESGAFTGARSQGKPGKFEIADGGTLFLDEIGEMAPNLQSKLLRVLQDGEFERVGGTKPIQVNVRIISATNQDLLTLINSGKFRMDLYYRLNVLSINIPSLALRNDDIPSLVSFFINKYNVEMGTKVNGISKSVLRVLENYDYPGNIRELENIIRRAIYLTEGDEIELQHLPEHLRQQAVVLPTFIEDELSPIRLKSVEAEKVEPVADKNPPPITGATKSYGKAIAERERELIIETLASTGGNRKRTADLLHIGRATLYEKMRRLGIPTSKK